MPPFICRELATIHMNDQGPTNLYDSVLFHIKHPLALLMVP